MKRINVTSCPSKIASIGVLGICGFVLLYTSFVQAQASCDPPCRKGYFCRDGQCISECNPPCPVGEHCMNGDCVPALPATILKMRERSNYFGVLGSYQIGINDSALSVGEIRAEFGSRYGAFQIGPGFGSGITTLRTAITGFVPIRVTDAVPFYILPMLGVGTKYSWIDDNNGTNYFEFFMVPSVRLRYDLMPQLSFLVDLVQVEINFLRFAETNSFSMQRQKVVPVQWNLSGGIVLRY